MNDSPASIAYKPFPSYSAWIAEKIALNGIQVVHEIRKELQSKSKRVQAEAIERVRSVAALETGAIENLYPSDRGLTITAAAGIAILDAVMQKHGQAARSYVESALDAYQYVLDFATKSRPIAAAFIRDVHSEICKSQTEFKVLVGENFESRELIKGRYKDMPNHVRLPDGTIHYYAPPLETAAEVDRLVAEMNGQEFDRSNAIDQASYAHYCLTAIHPFADGNGRVARAIASVFLYREYGLPLLIYATQRDEYFNALSRADSGIFSPFKNFMFASLLRAARLLRQSFRAAETASPIEALRSAASMYETSGGYLQVEVDQHAILLLKLLHQTFRNRLAVLMAGSGLPEDRMKSIQLECKLIGGNWPALRPEHRRPIESHQDRAVLLKIETFAPADAVANLVVAVSLPRDATPNDYFLLDTSPPGQSIEVPIADFMSGDTLEAETLVTLFADEVISRLIQSVAELGTNSLKKKGFGIE